LTQTEFTKILGWSGYRVYRHEIDEQKRTLKLWVRRKKGNKLLRCSNCGGVCKTVEEVREREVQDLPWRKYQTTVVVEYCRVRCPKCGVRVEQLDQLPSQAPFSKDFEDAVGMACESAAARQVARQFQLAASTVRSIDQRYLERWAKKRKKSVLRQVGVDEIYLGKTKKFLTVVSNLDTGEPLWFGQGRQKDTLESFFRDELSSLQRGRITALVWICGNRSPLASWNGRRSAVSSTTSFTLCSTPTGQWMKCGEPSSFAKEEPGAAW